MALSSYKIEYLYVNQQNIYATATVGLNGTVKQQNCIFKFPSF
jgi:hypothetical protein